MVVNKEEDEVVLEPFEQLRIKFLGELDNSTDLYCPEDIQRVRTSDAYCNRFILHKKGDFNAAYDMMKEALAWRKSFGVSGCTEDTIPYEFFEARAAFPYNSDKDNFPIILLLIRFHKKNPEYAKDMRRFVIYWVEKMDAEFNGSQMTVIMNCANAGLSNLDLDLIKFLITLFRSYYPHSLARILIYEMPWILNAAWGVIKAWLPEDFVEKIIFVNKTSILDYIDRANLPVDMGGTCTMEYEPPAPRVENEIETQRDNDSRKVHFSYNGLSSREDSFGDTMRTPRSGSYDRSHLLMTDDYCILAGMMKISPAVDLVFFPSATEEPSEVIITLSCVSDKTISFKVKTNNIGSYRVKPSTGIIAPNESIDVVVNLLPGKKPQYSDKFLIMVVPFSESSSSSISLSQFWKNSSPDMIADHKLRCVVGVPESEKSENKLNDALLNIKSSLTDLCTEVQQVRTNQQMIVKKQNIILTAMTLYGIACLSQIIWSNYSTMFLDYAFSPFW